MGLLRKGLALALLVGGGWLLSVYGMGNVVSSSLTPGVVFNTPVPDELSKVPTYLSADALVVVAEQQLSSLEPESLALRALAQDPAHGGAVAFLLSQYVAAGRESEATAAAELAGRLWPVHTYTHSRIADYWIAQDRVDKLIPELSLLLVREPGLRNSFFPVIDALTTSAGKLDLLAPYIAKPPTWWNSYFSYLSSRLSIDGLSEIYQLRQDSPTAIDEAERTSFVARLIRDKRWREAFKQWQAGLSAEQQSRLSNGLFDGGFEGEAFNVGFGWLLGRDKRFDIASRSTYGVTGQKALQVSFRQGLNRINFKHVSQQLLFAPGRYTLSYRTRLDALKNPKGLVWRVRCVSEANALLAEGAPMVGRHPWQAASFEFTVPKSCAIQSLVLEAVSKYPHELVFAGQLWLDDVAVKPLAAGAQ